MTKKLLILLCTFLSVAAMAQERVVTGRVTAKDGQPIPGVNIVVKGVTTGTVSDDEGKYSISIPEGATLILSSIGLISQELVVGNRSVLDVVMNEDVTELKEVMVTAQGIKREEKTLGYAVQSVKGEDLASRKSDNFVTALSGQVAGVQIRNNTNFGGSANVIIRGSSSLSGNNQPLYVIDGVPISNNNTNNLGQITGRSGYDFGNASSDINPSDIETLTVLKGAAATALYGSRAANGVILITTKKGKSGAKGIGISISSNYTISTVDKSTLPDYQQEYGAGYGPVYGRHENSFFNDIDITGDGVDDISVPFTEDASRGAKFDSNLKVYQYNSLYKESPYYKQATPWVAGANSPNKFFETGTIKNNTISVENANENSAYRLSYTNFDQKGVMPNSRLKRDNFFLTASHNFRKNFKVTAQANYIRTSGLGRPSTGYNDNIMSSFRQWWQMNTDIAEQRDLYFATGKNLTWNPSSHQDLKPIYWDNPYWVRYENYETDVRNRMIGFAQFDWDITKELSLMGRAAIDTYDQLQEERKAVGSGSGEFGVSRPKITSGYSRYTQAYTETNMDGILKYHKTLGQIDFTALVGVNIRRNRDDNVYASTSGGLAVPKVYALSNSSSPQLPPEESLLVSGINGVYGSLSLGYKGFLYLDATIRRDQSSTLPKEHSIFVYPAVSTSLVFSELMDIPFISYGKLRANFAEVGNNPIALRVKDTYTVLASYSGNPVATVNSARNQGAKNNLDLKPEKSRSVEAGLEMNFMKGRLGFDVAAYKTNSFNQSLQLKVSQATGYDAKWINAGEIQNSGIEVQLYGMPVKSEKIRWNVRVNWARNRNEVVSLYTDELGQEAKLYLLNTGSLQGGVSIAARKGEPYGAILGTDYLYHPNGQRLVKTNGRYEKTSTSDQLIGNATPKWTGGLRNAISYKSWDFSFLIDTQYGGDIFSLDLWYGTGSGLYKETAGLNELGNPKREPIQQNADGTYKPTTGGLLNSGVTSNGEPNTVRVRGDNYNADGERVSPNKRFVYDASYVKLREVSLTYNISKAMLEKMVGRFLQAASVSFVGSNLWIIHKNLPYADPEASQGSGNIQGWQTGVMPMTNNYGVTLNLKF